MEITPGRAPFSEDEDYKPLRRPKSASNTPTHGNSYNNSMDGAHNSLGVSLDSNASYGRTVSPSKLSPYAKEFVPQFAASSSSQSATASTSASSSSYHAQSSYNQQHQQQQPPHPHYQPPRQPRYANGYQQQQQQQHNHSQQQYGPQVASLTMNVQERLKIGGGGGGGNKHTANNYYQQQQQQQQQQSHGRHNKHHHHQQHQQHHHHHHNQHSNQQSHQQGRYHQQHRGGGGGGGGGSSGGGNHHQSNSAGGSNTAEVETIALDYLQTVIQCLNQNPGQFDTVASRFLTIFDGMENNQYVLSLAMEDIFQESIQNPNFRYMGAKLYNLLHMLNLKKDSLFHTLLKCKLDYHQTEVLEYMRTNQQQKVRETALFLAELYMQLRGDDTRIHLIAENIVYSLKQLLSKESSDNVRCICLTLKLAGYDLTSDCPRDMHEIIAQLDAINLQSPGKYPLAANVISLQKNNWGRKVNSPTAEAEAAAAAAMRTPEPLRISDEPIFYGPDGRELTAEEADFLSDGAAALGGGQGDEDTEDGGDLDVDFDPEMDEETEKAYKEFCKMSEKK